VKKKAKYAKIKIDYDAHAIPNASATAFTFAGKVELIAVDLQAFGVLVLGKERPSRVWSYPAGTELKDAVGLTFRSVLEEAAAQSSKKKAKA